MAKYTADNIWSIKDHLIKLETLNSDSYAITHGLSRYTESDGTKIWEEFVPTKFIYSMFAFNMLYNINWDESLSCGHIIQYSKNDEESKKMNELIKFVFSDTAFFNVDQKRWFRKIVLGGEDVNSIMDKLEGIEVDKNLFYDEEVDEDEVNRNGNITEEYFIERFKKSVHDVIGKNYYSIARGTKYSEGNINRIYYFIYKIRCNIFHGIKTIDEMKNDAQQERLVIYTRFLYAANTLVFCYLNFLSSLVEDKNNRDE